MGSTGSRPLDPSYKIPIETALLCARPWPLPTHVPPSDSASLSRTQGMSGLPFYPIPQESKEHDWVHLPASSTSHCKPRTSVWWVSAVCAGLSSTCYPVSIPQCTPVGTDTRASPEPCEDGSTVHSHYHPLFTSSPKPLVRGSELSTPWAHSQILTLQPSSH